MPRLRRVDCSAPGIARRRRGRGFSYTDERTGERVDDPAVLQRIRDLAIPPAWEQVWICPDERGHLQAVGTDAAGRRQYLYHEQWRARRDAAKFDRMVAFAEVLPAVRAECQRALTATDEPTRERVLAGAVRLLDYGFFRIGGEAYAETNDTFGLATIRKEHVTVTGEVIVFDYAAKGGKQRLQHVAAPEVVALVAQLRRRRGGGHELLAYREHNRWHDVGSRDVNEHLKALAGEEFSAKDFRTWNATVLAAVALAVSGEAAMSSASARKRAMARACQEVAHYLGNTPAVCRSSYIDPRVFDRFDSGWSVRGALESLGAASPDGQLAIHGAVEEAVLDLLRRRRDSDALERVAVA